MAKSSTSRPGTRNAEERSTTTPEAAPAEPWFALPQYAGSKARAVFGVVVILVLILSIVISPLVRELILRRQIGLPESQIWRAIDALNADRGEEGLALAKQVLGTTIEQPFEVDGLTYLAPHYQQLAALLMEKRYPDPAAAMALKALRHYHRVKRPLEYLAPWQMLARYTFETDPAAFIHVYDLIESHSSGSNEEFIRTGAATGRSLIDYANLRRNHYNMNPTIAASYARRMLSGRLDPSPYPEVRLASDATAIRSLRAVGDLEGARAGLERLRKDMPERLEIRALEFEIEHSGDGLAFADTLRSDSRYEIVNFSGLRLVEGEYKTFPTDFDRPRPPEILPTSEALLGSSATAELKFTIARPTRALYLVARGSDFLDIYPIVLVNFDAGPDRPIYADGRAYELIRLPVDLEAGEHALRVDFLNDYTGVIKGVRYDRNLFLGRLIVEF